MRQGKIAKVKIAAYPLHKLGQIAQGQIQDVIKIVATDGDNLASR